MTIPVTLSYYYTVLYGIIVKYVLQFIISSYYCYGLWNWRSFSLCVHIFQIKLMDFLDPLNIPSSVFCLLFSNRLSCEALDLISLLPNKGTPFWTRRSLLHCCLKGHSLNECDLSATDKSFVLKTNFYKSSDLHPVCITWLTSK